MTEPNRRTEPDSDDDRYRVLISGGSMGGLFAGHALRDAGHDVRIVERSSGPLGERGGGIVAQPRMRRFLADHGVADPEALVTTTHRRRYLAPDGSVRREYDGEMRFTSWDAVYRRLRAAFPDDRYRTGCEVVDDDRTEVGVVARLADGDEVAGDLLVAAEGWRSATRERHLPDATPEYAGYVAWRGVVPERELPGDLVAAFDDVFTFFDGDGEIVLAYLIPDADGSVAPGDRRLNWVWYDTVPSAELDGVLTDATGRRRDGAVPPGLLRDAVTERLREATAAHPPAFARLVRATDDPFVQPIVDLTVPQMTFERTCLLGDAAFVARPHTAAGTEKAARDGIALAATIGERTDLDEALDAWEASQLRFGEQLVEKGRRMGGDRLSDTD
jgi:2-polyprenyl-6-methoxyphenol hydroxylase-like FAD-dependent oxidoreductase